MSIFSLFFQNQSFSFPKAVRKYGLEQFAAAMAIIVRAKFSLDPMTRFGQVRQFLREEADAMHAAGGYAAEFARTIFRDTSDYIGAMGEDTEYPIDYPGGPQQVLLQMTLEFMHQTSDSIEAIKFRCAVVKNIALIENCALKNAVSPESIDQQTLLRIQKNVDAADDLLGILIKKYRGYFKQFMGR